MTLHIGVARHSETDNQAEHTIQTIKQMIRMYLNKIATNWFKYHSQNFSTTQQHTQAQVNHSLKWYKGKTQEIQ
jgi:hypothetical protein